MIGQDWIKRMLAEQAEGLLRHFLSGAGAALVAKGVMTGDQENQIIGGIVAAVAVLLSVWQKHRAAVALQAAAPAVTLAPTPAFQPTPPAAVADDLKGLY